MSPDSVMRMHRGIALTIVLGCFLLSSLVPFGSAVSAGEDANDEVQHHWSIGGRILLQNLKPCPHQFSLDNFTNLELACPQANISDPNYPKKSCCAALADMLCPYQQYVNDPSYSCAESFWDTLPLATGNNLTVTTFQSACSDPNSPLGIPCPAGAPAPSPNRSPPPVSLQVLDVTVLLAAAAIGLLHSRF